MRESHKGTSWLFSRTARIVNSTFGMLLSLLQETSLAQARNGLVGRDQRDAVWRRLVVLRFAKYVASCIYRSESHRQASSPLCVHSGKASNNFGLHA